MHRSFWPAICNCFCVMRLNVTKLLFSCFTHPSCTNFFSTLNYFKFSNCFRLILKICLFQFYLCRKGLKVHHRYENIHLKLLFVIDNNQPPTSCITSQWPNTHSSLSVDTMPRFSSEMMHARLDYKTNEIKFSFLEKLKVLLLRDILDVPFIPFHWVPWNIHLMSYCLIWWTLRDNEVFNGCVLRKKFIK